MDIAQIPAATQPIPVHPVKMFNNAIEPVRERFLPSAIAVGMRYAAQDRTEPPTQTAAPASKMLSATTLQVDAASAAGKIRSLRIMPHSSPPPHRWCVELFLIRNASTDAPDRVLTNEMMHEHARSLSIRA